MAIYKNAILTDAGRRLLQDVVIGNGEIEFLYVKTGCGTCGDDTARRLMDIVDPVQKFYFNSISREGNDSVILKISVTNEGLKHPYSLTELGVFARKKGEADETLYCIIIAEEADTIPADTQNYQVVFRILVKLHDAVEATIIMNSNAFALAGDLQDENARAEATERQLMKDINTESERAAEAEEELRRQKLDVDGDASDVTVDFSEAEELKPMENLRKLSDILAVSAKAASVLIAHLANTNKVDNTSDMEKPVSTAQQAALDELHAQLTAYADKAVADLINGAPSTLDTLGEIAKAMAENADVVSALNEAIGKKANEAEFDSHVKDTTVHVTAADRDTWNNKLSTAGGTVSGSIVVSGTLHAGNNVKLVSSSEGGNIQIIATDGTIWEIDAHGSGNSDLRIFTYANNVKIGLNIDKLGQVAFPNGAYGTLYGSVIAQGGVGGRGTQMSANGFHIDMPAEEGYAGGLAWYQGNTVVGCFGYYKQGGYHYVGTSYSVPNGELRAGVIHASHDIYIDSIQSALRVRHIEGTSDGRLFLNYNQPSADVIVGDTSAEGTGYGRLRAGKKASIFSDSEGGNISFISPNGVEWQMDAHNDYFRLYGYPNNAYSLYMRASGDGMMDFPQGIYASKIAGRSAAMGSYLIIEPLLGAESLQIEVGHATIVTGSMYVTSLRPHTDKGYDFGLPSKRWGNIYAANSVISTSDETTKRNITPLDENLTKDFIMGLNPISYIKTDGESGRTHYGLGAQSVERLMESLGMSSQDFAGLIKSPITEEYEVEEEVEVEKLIPNENGKPIPQKVKEIQKVTKQREIPGRYRYGLRYEEFISPLTKVVQMQQKEIEELRKSKDEIENRLRKIEKMLGI